MVELDVNQTVLLQHLLLHSSTLFADVLFNLVTLVHKDIEELLRFLLQASLIFVNE